MLHFLRKHHENSYFPNTNVDKGTIVALTINTKVAWKINSLLHKIVSVISEVLLRMHFTWRKLVLLMSWTLPKAHARVWLTRTRIFIGRSASNTRDSSFWMWRKPTLPCILPKLPTTSMKHWNPEVQNFCIHSLACWVSVLLRRILLSLSKLHLTKQQDQCFCDTLKISSYNWPDRSLFWNSVYILWAHIWLEQCLAEYKSWLCFAPSQNGLKSGMLWYEKKRVCNFILTFLGKASSLSSWRHTER